MKIAALCAGYGGLEIAVQNMFDAEVSWYAEYDIEASKVLAHHMPGVPNIGDITDVDWSSLPVVDIVTAGFPCQDISHAGPRVGITGKRSGIWKNVLEAVQVLRPGLVFLENVAAIKRRGLDVLVEDLAAIGYGVQWVYLRASDVGAPHQRHRWFAVARPGGPTGEVKSVRPAKRPESNLLPPPTTKEATSGPGRSTKRTGGDNLRTVVNHLLPTPTARDWKSSASNLMGTNARPLNETIAHTENWVCVDGKDFGPAVRRWEQITGCPAPRSIIDGPRGGKKTSPFLVEWMMGVPDGHVTCVPDLTINKMLMILGNGVVPAQAESAYRAILHI